MAVPFLLFAIALVARMLAAAIFSEPAYPDAYYYASVARSVAEGHGLEIAYIWNFVDVGGVLPAEGVLPIPSNAHWMPLAALVQVPFIWVLGATPLASGLPFWITAAAVAPLTYLIGTDAGMERAQAAMAGLLVALPGGIAPFLGQPDNFALFMLLGALALWLCARGLRGDRRSFALGGLAVGLAFLSRTDGVLLAVPFALAFVADLLREPRGSRIGWRPAALFAVFLMVCAVPWLLRQVEVFGSLSPSAANGRILWITDYRQLFSVSSEATAESFLAQGPLAIAWSRMGGLAFALILFAAMPLLFLLVPLLLAGTWHTRRNSDFVPWIVYAIALFAFTALVSAVHVPYGTFLHSAVALVPHAYLLVLLGVAAIIGAIGSRRPSWDVPRATRNISVMVVGVIIVGAIGASFLTLKAWARERDGRMEVLAALARHADVDDRVMSPDPGAYHYRGGWSGIVTPDDPLTVVEKALRLYEVRWLALERDHLTESLLPVLNGALRPTWLSPPVVEVPGIADDSDDGSPAASNEAGPAALPRAALYAVCLEPGDGRCAT